MNSLQTKRLEWMGFSLALLFVACLNDAPGDAPPAGNPLVDTTHADTSRADTAFADGAGSGPGARDTLPSNWRELAAVAAGRPVRSVSRGDSLFVAVGDSGAVATSRDGVVWTAAVSGTDARLDTVLGGSGGSPFLAVSYSTPWLVSGDGLTWDRVAFSGSLWSHSVAGIAWNGKVFVLIGISLYPDSPRTENRIWYSEDGIAWKWGVTPHLHEPFVKSIQGDTATGLFTLRDASNGVYVSSDGITWSPP